MTPAETLSCFDWRPMESPPDPHDDVFVRYPGPKIYAGRLIGGYLYIRTDTTGSISRVCGPIEAWAPVGETPTPKMGHVV